MEGGSGGVIGWRFGGKKLFDGYFAMSVPFGAFEERVTIGEEELCPVVVRRGCFGDGLNMRNEEEKEGKKGEGGRHGVRERGKRKGGAGRPEMEEKGRGERREGVSGVKAVGSCCSWV